MPVDKPAGISSFGVVARVRGIVKAETGQKIKIGHTGTLDPMATGLMILVLGKYTKRAAEFSKLDKAYEAELTLGAVSTTGDREGKIEEKSPNRPERERIDEVLNGFIGTIEQTPPAFSAVKVGGRRAYDLARQGKAVDIKPRQVTIYSITKVEYEYPRLSFMVKVSSGTYIRSLAADIGQALGTGAYLSGLRRTQVGDYDIEDAISIDNIKYNVIVNNVRQTSQ